MVFDFVLLVSWLIFVYAYGIEYTLTMKTPNQPLWKWGIKAYLILAVAPIWVPFHFGYGLHRKLAEK